MILSVRVPATTANLGSGFDCIGLAVDWYDELTLETLDAPGLVIEVTGEGAESVPRDSSHLVIATIEHCLRQWGVTMPSGMRLAAHNTIPHSRGLGSSAAAIAAGCALAHGIARPGEAPDPVELARLASLLEGHPDNAGAAVHGGAILAWIHDGDVELLHLDPAAGLRCVVFVPEFEVPTAGARSVLPEAVPRSDAVAQAIAAASLPKALELRPDLLLAATEDRLHQQYRAGLMPESWDLMSRLRAEGVPAVISGAGPTVLAIGLPEQLGPTSTVRHDGFIRRDLGIGHGLELISRDF